MPDPVARDQYIALFEHRMSDLSNQLANGDITLQDWQIEMRLQIREAYAAQIWSATDGNPGMNDYLKMGTTVQQQDRYLEKFAHDIQDGNVNPDAIASRASMYANASKEAYWNQATGDVQLPAYPGDGSTQCLSNCLCEWVDNGDGSFTWDRRNERGTSCEDCIHNAEIYNPYWPDGAQAQAA